MVIRSAWEKYIGANMSKFSVGAEGCMMTLIEVSLLALFSGSASNLEIECAVRHIRLLLINVVLNLY